MRVWKYLRIEIRDRLQPSFTVTSPLHIPVDIRPEILSKVREILIKTYHLPLGRRVNATVPFSDSYSDSTVRVSENARIEIRERL